MDKPNIWWETWCDSKYLIYSIMSGDIWIFNINVPLFDPLSLYLTFIMIFADTHPLNDY